MPCPSEIFLFGLLYEPPPAPFLSNHLVFLPPFFHFGLWHRRRRDNSPHALNQPAVGMRRRDPAATTEEALNSSFHRKEEKKVPWEEVKQKGRRSARMSVGVSREEGGGEGNTKFSSRSGREKKRKRRRGRRKRFDTFQHGICQLLPA